MKISVEELRGIIGEIISEAKKKTKSEKKTKKEVKPTGFFFDEALDFSDPLGPLNIYAIQGASNWGPLTGVLPDVGPLEERAVRSLVRQVISERKDLSAWSRFGTRSAPKNVWEAAMHWYDNQRLGLGSQTSEGIEQKKAENAKNDKKSKKKKGCK